MTDRETTDPAPVHRLHHIQVKRAFLDDAEHRARPAQLIATDQGAVQVRYLDDGTTGTVTVADPARLDAILARTDLCRVDDKPLLLVNTTYRVLGIATGPASPPPQLRVLIVSRLENGEVVELVNEDPQPAWQLLALAPVNHDING